MRAPYHVTTLFLYYITLRPGTHLSGLCISKGTYDTAYFYSISSIVPTHSRPPKSLFTIELLELATTESRTYFIHLLHLLSTTS